MWRRHTGDSTWHVGADVGGSFVTCCRGRWPLTDEVAGDVEYDTSPPHDARCDECQRVRIEQLRVERGLAELGDADLDNPLGFDLGGEG